MALLQVADLTKHFAADPLLDGVALRIDGRDRIGLVGPNGSGKTTLLRILAGELEPDRGTIDRAAGLRVGLLRQTFDGPATQTLWEFAESGLSEIRDWVRRAAELAERIGAAPHDPASGQWARQFDALQQRIEQVDGFHTDHRVERVLDGLGFSAGDRRRPIAQLSGGQVNRMMLAHLLLSAPDLMLLDEPSNHLDLEATQWLESFLAGTRQAFVVVSHDRYLLDRVTDQTLELLHASVERYPGNYTKYVQLKAQRLEVERRAYARRQEQIEKLKDFIRRNHYGQKHAQAEDRRKKLAQVERQPLARPREIERPAMRFGSVDRAGDVVLRGTRIEKRFEATLFADLSFQIERGQRWGILGPNGCGKSTLLRCLLGDEPLTAGRVQWGAGVRPGYFDQLLECVARGPTPLDVVRPDHRELLDQARRDLLARFGITGELAVAPIEQLSGGQRNRVALARLAAAEANLLVLDEPTNHLDLWSRESLAEALREYPGSVLLVSHDRYFVNQVCNHLLVFERGRVSVVEGNYETYLALRQAAAPPAVEPPAGLGDRRRGEGARPRRRFPYRKIDDLERDIAHSEAAIAELHAALADPAVLRDRQRVLEARRRLNDAQQALERLYEHWSEACELD